MRVLLKKTLPLLAFFTESPFLICAIRSAPLVNIYNFVNILWLFAQALHRQFPIFLDLFVFALFYNKEFTFP